MKQYLVKFWTKSGQLTSLMVGAGNSAAAIAIVRELPHFSSLAGVVREVSS